MLMCNVFIAEDERAKLIIQPEITDGGEEIEIVLSKKEAAAIKDLEDLSNERE